MSMMKRGDTIIEILFALSVFSLVSILALNLMNNGIVSAQASLERTMVRNEINAQAEALRFIHDTVTSGSADNNYTAMWNEITQLVQQNKSNTMDSFQYPPENITRLEDRTCANYYQQDSSNYLAKKHAFILNTRHLQQQRQEGEQSPVLEFNLSGEPTFRPADNYARILYDGDREDLTTNVEASRALLVEGIWIIGVPSSVVVSGSPQYYDFYIQSCWYPPGEDLATGVGTVVRLYNPAEARR